MLGRYCEGRPFCSESDAAIYVLALLMKEGVQWHFGQFIEQYGEVDEIVGVLWMMALYARLVS